MIKKSPFLHYHISGYDSPEIRLLKIVANRLNLAEHETPGGVYMLAALRPEVNELLGRLEQWERERRRATWYFRWFNLGSEYCRDAEAMTLKELPDETKVRRELYHNQTTGMVDYYKYKRCSI